MDVSKVPPHSACDQLEAVLDSVEVGRLIRTLEYIRWTGRKGYGPRAMVGMCLVKTLYAIPTWSRVCRLVAEHEGLQRVVGAIPSQWACYRFARQLRERDLWALEQCIRDVLAGLHAQHPDMGRDIAIDASDLPAYSNGKRTNAEDSRPVSDPDASWGRRSAVSTRSAGAFFGFKIDAAVDVVTGLPVAWDVRTAKHVEADFALGLIDQAKAHGFSPQTAIMDKGYDSAMIHSWCMNRGVAPVVPLRETQGVKQGKAEPPHCVHGEWTFAGADYKRQATKWRCPTGECNAKSMWVKADRLHPLIPRESKRYDQLYRKRGAVEREFGRLKHEWAMLPLRVRGIARVQLHTDLTILAKLAGRLAMDRCWELPAAA